MDLGRQGVEAGGCQNGRMTHTIFLISFFFKFIYSKPKEIKQRERKGDHWLGLGDIRKNGKRENPGLGCLLGRWETMDKGRDEQAPT